MATNQNEGIGPMVKVGNFFNDFLMRKLKVKSVSLALL